MSISEDKEVAALINSDKSKKNDEAPRKLKVRSPSQSPVTVQKTENLFPTQEDREKFKNGSSKWVKDIEEGFFTKIDKQFEASINGYGMENGIELDTSGSADEENSNGHHHHGHPETDPVAVAAEYWQEVTAKANLSGGKTSGATMQNTSGLAGGDHSGVGMLHRPGGDLGSRATDSPASSLRSTETPMMQQQQNLRSYPPMSPQRYSPKPDMPNNMGQYNDGRQRQSPGILQYRGPPLRGPQQGNRNMGPVQTGYMRNMRYDGNRDMDGMTDSFRDRMRLRDGGDYQTRRFQPINLGPYADLFSKPLPNSAKIFDSHAHWCFGIKKLQSQGIETYRDMKSSFPEMFPPSYGGSIQVFCLPLYLKSYDHWHRKLIEGTENELWFTYGCHPNFVDDWNEDVKAGMSFSMQRANETRRLVGLGEIGLDYNRQNNNEAKKERQREVFKIQLDMATKHNLPIVIHCRNDEGPGGNNQAELDCFDIIRERVPHNWPIHRHCFRGSFNEATKWMDYFTNVAFGFTPCITGTKDVMAREAVKMLPLEKILLETDAPYYTPASMSNFPVESSGDKQPRKVAIPGGIALVTADEISKIRGIPIETVAQATRENTLRLYQIEV